MSVLRQRNLHSDDYRYERVTISFGNDHYLGWQSNPVPHNHTLRLHDSCRRLSIRLRSSDKRLRSWWNSHLRIFHRVVLFRNTYNRRRTSRGNGWIGAKLGFAEIQLCRELQLGGNLLG
jgi:hypothetical protein